MPRKQTEEQVKRRRIDDLWESILRQELPNSHDLTIWDQTAYAIVRGILETDGSWVDHTLWDSWDWTRLDRVMKRLGFTSKHVDGKLFYSKRS